MTRRNGVTYGNTLRTQRQTVWGILNIATYNNKEKIELEWNNINMFVSNQQWLQSGNKLIRNNKNSCECWVKV